MGMLDEFEPDETPEDAPLRGRRTVLDPVEIVGGPQGSVTMGPGGRVKGPEAAPDLATGTRLEAEGQARQQRQDDAQHSPMYDFIASQGGAGALPSAERGRTRRRWGDLWDELLENPGDVAAQGFEGLTRGHGAEVARAFAEADPGDSIYGGYDSAEERRAGGQAVEDSTRRYLQQAEQRSPQSTSVGRSIGAVAPYLIPGVGGGGALAQGALGAADAAAQVHGYSDGQAEAEDYLAPVALGGALGAAPALAGRAYQGARGAIERAGAGRDEALIRSMAPAGRGDAAMREFVGNAQTPAQERQAVSRAAESLRRQGIGPRIGTPAGVAQRAESALDAAGGRMGEVAEQMQGRGPMGPDIASAVRARRGEYREAAARPVRDAMRSFAREVDSAYTEQVPVFEEAGTPIPHIPRAAPAPPPLDAQAGIRDYRQGMAAAGVDEGMTAELAEPFPDWRPQQAAPEVDDAVAASPAARRRAAARAAERAAQAPPPPPAPEVPASPPPREAISPPPQVEQIPAGTASVSRPMDHAALLRERALLRDQGAYRGRGGQPVPMPQQAREAIDRTLVDQYEGSVEQHLGPEMRQQHAAARGDYDVAHRARDLATGRAPGLSPTQAMAAGAGGVAAAMHSPGAAAGAAAGAGLLAMGRQIAPSVRASGAELMYQLAQRMPERMGPYARMLLESGGRGTGALATMHHVLSQQDPTYRQLAEQLAQEQPNE
jgi:hypothetical protein